MGQNWVEAETTGCDLGDIRLNRRLAAMLEVLGSMQTRGRPKRYLYFFACDLARLGVGPALGFGWVCLTRFFQSSAGFFFILSSARIWPGQKLQ